MIHPRAAIEVAARVRDLGGELKHTTMNQMITASVGIIRQNGYYFMQVIAPDGSQYIMNVTCVDAIRMARDEQIEILDMNAIDLEKLLD